MKTKKRLNDLIFWNPKVPLWAVTPVLAVQLVLALLQPAAFLGCGGGGGGGAGGAASVTPPACVGNGVYYASADGAIKKTIEQCCQSDSLNFYHQPKEFYSSVDQCILCGQRDCPQRIGDDPAHEGIQEGWKTAGVLRNLVSGPAQSAPLIPAGDASANAWQFSATGAAEAGEVSQPGASGGAVQKQGSDRMTPVTPALNFSRPGIGGGLRSGPSGSNSSSGGQGLESAGPMDSIALGSQTPVKSLADSESGMAYSQAASRGDKKGSSVSGRGSLGQGAGRSLSVAFSGEKTQEFGQRSDNEPPILLEDPEDYFTRIDLGTSLFQVIHARYEAKASGWILQPSPKEEDKKSPKRSS
ncbi:MAG: hypothetical protein ACO3A2_02465 [Bdellovibrionia bacterium]